jgi:hypothetical protein
MSAALAWWQRWRSISSPTATSCPRSLRYGVDRRRRHIGTVTVVTSSFSGWFASAARRPLRPRARATPQTWPATPTISVGPAGSPRCEHQAAFAGDQVELVSVLYVASAFDDKSQRLPTLACHNRLPPTVVTHNTMSPELLAAVGPRFGQLGFPERGAGSRPGLVVGRTGEGSFFHPFAIPVLRVQASSWTHPTSPAGMHTCCSDRQKPDVADERHKAGTVSRAHCRAMGFFQLLEPSLVVGRWEQEAHRSRLSPPGLTCRDRGGLARSASTWSREMTALTARFGDPASWVLTMSKMPQHPHRCD